MEKGKVKNIFVAGAIDPSFIAGLIAQHNVKTRQGGHSIFLGQVRADVVDGKVCAAIDYTAYEEMANEKMMEIRESIFQQFSIDCLHVYHSLGRVAAGYISLFVFASSAHRKAAMDACEETVERLKAELPVWGRELFEDETHQWKINR